MNDQSSREMTLAEVMNTLPEQHHAREEYDDLMGRAPRLPRGTGRYGYLSVPVLEFLWGSQHDQYTRCFLRALRPSEVRIVRGGCQMDARKWRVTIWIEKDPAYPNRERIKRITQEVEVDLVEGVEHGAALARHMGLRS